MLKNTKRPTMFCTLRPVTEIELAYLGGIIDGEGSITIARYKLKTKYRDGKQRTAFRISAAVAMVDRKAVAILKEIFGGCLSYVDRGLKNPKHRPIWRWEITCARAAYFIDTILPYLLLKKKQAELAMAFHSRVSNSSMRRVANGYKFYHALDEELKTREFMHHRMQELKREAVL